MFVGGEGVPQGTGEGGVGGYAHLQHLTNLADYSSGDNELSIQVLIGMDYYYSFITDKIIRGTHPVDIGRPWIVQGTFHIGPSFLGRL